MKQFKQRPFTLLDLWRMCFRVMFRNYQLQRYWDK